MISDVMMKYCDRLIHLFHKHNLSFGASWQDMMRLLSREPRNGELFQLLQEMMADITNSLQDIQNPTEAIVSDAVSNDNSNNSEVSSDNDDNSDNEEKVGVD